MRIIALLSLLLLFGACRIGVGEPLPISGESPEVIAVWPIAIGAEPSDSDLWFTGLSSALTRRGYRVLPPGITAELLRTSDIAASADNIEGVGRALRADAVLRLEVRRFDAEGLSGLQHAEWDLKWRLLSTRGRGEQWAFSHHGHYHQVDSVTFDPGRSLDEHYQPRDIVPVGGSGSPSFRSAQDLMANLNNLAISRLPKR
ncbi:MAG: hypothetical protein ACJA0V_000444 [Planctomycetota bacterium]|jgi:hypothetical protein